MKILVHCWPTGELIFILLNEINLEPEKKCDKMRNLRNTNFVWADCDFV